MIMMGCTTSNGRLRAPNIDIPAWSANPMDLRSHDAGFHSFYGSVIHLLLCYMFTFTIDPHDNSTVGITLARSMFSVEVASHH